jgi:hypothetical protein
MLHVHSLKTWLSAVSLPRILITSMNWQPLSIIVVYSFSISVVLYCMDIAACDIYHWIVSCSGGEVQRMSPGR